MTFLEGLRYVFEAVETMLSWLFRYPLLLLQIVLLLLIALAGLGADLGLDDLFWSDSFVEQLVNGLGCALLFGEIFLVRYLLDKWHPGDFTFPISLFPVADTEVKALGQYLAVFWIASLLILAVPKLFYHEVMTGATQVGPFWIGMALAVLLTSLAVVLASWSGLIDVVQNTRLPGAGGNGPLHAVAFLAALLFFLGGGSVYALHVAGVVLAPVFVLCLLLALADAVHGLLAYWAPGSQFIALLVLVGGGLLANSSMVNRDGDYKLTFPNLEEHYAQRVHIDEEVIKGGDGKEKRVDHYYELLKAQAEGKAAKPDLIPSEEPLRAMAERWRAAHKDGTKPRLVIVATSGGGIRAAVWTAVVLEGLERELRPAFREHIRMFTGASGGMVAAGLYVADFEKDPPAGQRALDPQTGLRELSGGLARDSLRRPVETMLLHDLPSLWWPRGVANDRGRELERDWAENTGHDGKPSPFRKPFAELQALERKGQRPSLVFSPMLVEDARRLLISNLDLLDMTWTSGSVIGFEPFRKQSEIPEAPNQPLLSLSAVELFRLFPTAPAKFEVGTAARMNASFPLVSPGVSLPTTPPRRVVDAGYYDNHGVNLAALWLYRHEKAIREHTSGVVIVEIRAYRNGYQRWHFQDKETEKTTPDPKMAKTDDNNKPQPRRSRDALTASLEWLSTPAEAVLNARDRAIYYRNDELLDGLSAHFNRAGGDFFATLAFECEVDAALSWTLPTSDAAVIARAFHKDPSAADPAQRMPRWIQKRVEALNTWFGDGGR